uniref:SCP2 domain-containing protein n=1 Tax=Lates calcarifer TaxID=8187 RepID=A0A4W6FGM6_LATCA
MSRIHAINTSASDGLEGFKAHAVFQEINKKLQEDGEQFVKKIGGVFAFKVKDGPNGQEATWFVDVKNGKGCVHNDTGKKTQWPKNILTRQWKPIEACNDVNI